MSGSRDDRSVVATFRPRGHRPPVAGLLQHPRRDRPSRPRRRPHRPDLMRRFLVQALSVSDGISSRPPISRLDPPAYAGGFYGNGHKSRCFTETGTHPDVLWERAYIPMFYGNGHTSRCFMGTGTHPDVLWKRAHIPMFYGNVHTSPERERRDSLLAGQPAASSIVAA